MKHRTFTGNIDQFEFTREQGRTFARAIFGAILIALASSCSKNESSPKEVSPPPAETPVESKTQEIATQNTPEEAPVNSSPALEYFPDIKYPQELQMRAMEGEVCLKVRVNAEGKAEDISVVSSTDPGFEQPLVESVDKWKFSPARKDGIAVSRTLRIAIPFFITNRDATLPTYMNSQPELAGIVRPPHMGVGKTGEAIAKISISKNSLITDISVLSATEEVDQDALRATIAQWVFNPSKSKYGSGLPSVVLAKITYTDSGNVLVQYPYPAPPPSSIEK